MAMNHLEIKHLRMVAAIAKTGNMTRAADNLCLSQSALSQQLKDIEGKLGADLFFRTKKKMILTPIGRKLLATADQVTRLVEDVELEIARNSQGEQGELKIGVQCPFCYRWLPDALRIFQEKFPNVELIIGTAYDSAEDLENGKFDFIITAAPRGDVRWSYAPLFADTMVCGMPVGHQLSGQLWIGLDDFRHYNMISHAERGRNRFYQAVLKPQGVEPKRFLTVDQPQAMLEMVAAGLGIGIFPAWAVREAAESGKIVTRPLTEKGLGLYWQAVSLRSGNVPAFKEEFIRIIERLKINAKESQGVMTAAVSRKSKIGEKRKSRVLTL